jgi:hypothetical protein
MEQPLLQTRVGGTAIALAVEREGGELLGREFEAAPAQ